MFTLRVDGATIPLSLFGFHQSMRGLQPILFGSGPAVVGGIRPGRIEVVAGPLDGGTLPRDFFLAPAYRDSLPRGGAGVDTIAGDVVPFSSRLKEDSDMSAVTVTVWDENTLGEKRQHARLHLASQTVTARELIEQRVRQEVDTYNRSQPEIFSGLVQPDGAEAALNGFRLPMRRTIDTEAQVINATKGFQSNRIILLVDDEQLEALDYPVTLREGSRITFLKLVPLVGG